MRFKKINSDEKNFYVFETSPRIFSIFDSGLNEPLYYGSWNMCEGIIKNIKKHIKNVSIYYYVKEKNGSLKLSPIWSHNI
jgi:hypothetical protein